MTDRISWFQKISSKLYGAGPLDLMEYQFAAPDLARLRELKCALVAFPELPRF